MIGHQEIGESCKSQKIHETPDMFKTNISILNEGKKYNIAHSDPAIINSHFRPPKFFSMLKFNNKKLYVAFS